MAKGRKFFLEKANVMVCNTSGVFIVLLGLITFVVFKFAFQARSTTDNMPDDFLVVNDVQSIIPQIGFKIRQIQTDSVIGNTTSLYYHIEQLKHLKDSQMQESNHFIMVYQRINVQKSQKKSGHSMNMDLDKILNAQENGMGLDSFTELQIKSKVVDDQLNTIYKYFRKETQTFVEQLSNHYSTIIYDYLVLYYIFVGLKIFMYGIFIFRMYSAISVLNKIKISFEEYSRSKRGLPLFILFVCLCVTSTLQFKQFNNFANNTQSTAQLSTNLMYRYADIYYASDYIFESSYFGSTKIYEYNEIMLTILQKVENNDEKIFKTIKGSLNQFTYHFENFQNELSLLQTQYKCDQYFEFLFKLNDCKDFCLTELKLYDKDKQLIPIPDDKHDDKNQINKTFICALQKQDAGQIGIQNAVKNLKQQIKSIREEQGSHGISEASDQQQEKERKRFEFMYKHYQKFQEEYLYNIKLHTDYLVKLLQKNYKDYQIEFDKYIYIYLFLDLIVGCIFIVLWIFYFRYLIKGLSKHKSKFEEVKESAM